MLQSRCDICGSSIGKTLDDTYACSRDPTHYSFGGVGSGIKGHTAAAKAHEAAAAAHERAAETPSVQNSLDARNASKMAKEHTASVYGASASKTAKEHAKSTTSALPQFLAAEAHESAQSAAARMRQGDARAVGTHYQTATLHKQAAEEHQRAES